MAETRAHLSFLPWVRQGAAAGIAAVDTLGAGQPAVAQLAVSVAVNQGALPAMPLRLRGPADVVGIDPRQIIRVDPAPDTRDAEPNYFPCIEFDRPDFPWLFTPARATTNARLRPWLCLVVVKKQDGITLGRRGDARLPALEIASPANAAGELPSLEDAWAWAHAQVASGASAPEVSGALDGGSHLTLSRLLCPRLLAPNTAYLACVVPTFELGRRAGLGVPVEDGDLTADRALAAAWSTNGQSPVLLPVYYSWEFATGATGDFESLVRQLRPRPVPAAFGTRQIDISRPGFALPAELPAATTLAVEGALQAIDTPDSPAPWADEVAVPFQTTLAEILNAPGEAAIVDPEDDPLLAPPLYGRWHAARATVRRGSNEWLDQLNLDPRSRTVAAFGTRVVQEHQEALMATAWEQAAELRQANQRMRQLQVSVAVGLSLQARHFARLTPEAALRIGGPAIARIRSVDGDPVERTLVARLQRTALPVAAASTAMRRLGRERGPLTRRAAAQGVIRSNTTPWLATLGRGSVTFVVPAADFVTISAVRRRLAANVSLRPYLEVTEPLIAGLVGRPNFRVLPDGAPVPVPPAVLIILPDNQAAAAFRAAAREHLARVNPGRLGMLFGPPPPLAIEDVRKTLVAHAEPRMAAAARARALVRVGPSAVKPVDTPSSAATGIDTIMAAPKFGQPMYEPLRDLSQDLMLPGLDSVAPDTVVGLKTNRRFVDAYMVGLNMEMGRELLWRGYPTDQRATCFDQFWDAAAAGAPRPDIEPLTRWGNRRLGDPSGAPAREQFVMLVRSTLLRRYPNAIIYAARAVMNNGSRAPGTKPEDEVHPAFRGIFPPDVSFFGFDLAPDAVTGTDGSAGFYIVIQEHPTEPRFGLDVGTPTGTATYLAIASGPPAGLALEGLEWGRNAAHMAGIVRQLPVRIAIHASEFIGSF
jgi:hypothetical protein